MLGLDSDQGECKMYKLIAIDMDGTLLNDLHEVTEEVRNALHAAKSKASKSFSARAVLSAV